ncbi:hypothetical protein N657DRAFT_580811 [Parathielavia appendiculata]|uniref:Uncharacterized protein n=1 Tax=Parathielavia appendiculata TaxID=2587402 RepID=A0AAN6TSK3_9PEZI|nr:hypothetical protein N657DRAFT_580811 [Parathielavia appendiculata]
MYTALRLIVIGCQFSGLETLGMAVVDNPVSAWYGHIPVPRMVKNQVNHLLELRMIELDREITGALSRLSRDRRQWIVGTLAVFLLLHIRELDAGRIIYWARYKDSAGFWIHPSRPSALIDEGVASCNSLLRYFHCFLGRQPLCQNWDEERSQRLVGNDAELVASIKALQSCVSMMRQAGWIGRNASQLYQDGHPDSVGLTISSLIFTEMADAQVKNFH